jgi:glycine betaine/choline ABC-type transport system substrate-binding protein
MEVKTKKERTNKMYDDVRQEYKKLSEIKLHGVTKFSHDYIVLVISNQFYRSPKTIENIIFNRV